MCQIKVIFLLYIPKKCVTLHAIWEITLKIIFGAYSLKDIQLKRYTLLIIKDAHYLIITLTTPVLV